MDSSDERTLEPQGEAPPVDSPRSPLLTAVALLSGDALRDAARRYPASLGGLDGLARALAASPIWGDSPRAAIVLRSEPHPSLSVLGYLSDSARTRLSALRDDLPRTLHSLHYVDYARAESDCVVLARKLTDRLGRDQIQQSYFVAVPRGGFIVLGMLAYTLGLQPHQLTPPPPGAPLVVVDDCALTGARLREQLEAYAQHDLTFAFLYAHPALCAAVEREERVHACLSAYPLHDHAPDQFGDAYAAWRDRWAARTERFWIGLPDHVCFAWNEPDITLWNADAETPESGWRLLPPDDRLRLRTTEALPVQMLQTGAYLSLPPAVIYADLGEDIVICNTTDGQGLTLAPPAADVFRAMVRADRESDAIQTAATTANVSTEWATAHIQRIRHRLMGAGLLETEPAPGDL